MSKFVWRFEWEHTSGEWGGIFSGEYAPPFASQYKADYIAPPIPYDDEGPIAWEYMLGLDITGFDNISQAKRWFKHPDDPVIYDNPKVKLKAYPKSDTIHLTKGKHQVGFIPRDDYNYAEFPPHIIWEKHPTELEREALEKIHGT